MPAMRVSSAFSGMGGLDLGLQQAGHRIIFQCESDPSARQVRRALAVHCSTASEQAGAGKAECSRPSHANLRQMSSTQLMSCSI